MTHKPGGQIELAQRLELHLKNPLTLQNKHQTKQKYKRLNFLNYC